jgi:hypothetical protein
MRWLESSPPISPPPSLSIPASSPLSTSATLPPNTTPPPATEPSAECKALFATEPNIAQHFSGKEVYNTYKR